MAVTAETRTSLIGLSVVMLGSAPGTDLLNDWVNAINDGMTVEDIANHIAGSDDFTTTYPTFLTNEEFATSFLNNLMGGEDVPAALVTAAVGIVTGLLNDGMTRGALSLAVVGAMYDIHAQGEAHAAYGDLGVVADGLFNKIEVAEHYTLNARLESPSSSVLDGVNSNAVTVTDAIEAIDSAAESGIQGQTYVLTTVRDDINGTSADDLIVAEPIAQVSNVFLETLNPFDDIDGAGGNDTIAIYGVDPTESLSLGAEQVRNVENVILSTVGAIDADMSSWEGLEAVDLQRFGRSSDVEIIVDGATVSTEMTFGGAATIVGASGEVSITASDTSYVHIGSAGHTGSVSVNGGGSITVNNGAGKHSETVSSVSVDGLAADAGTSTEVESYTLITDVDGFVLDENALSQVGVTIAGDEGANPNGTVTSIKLDDADDDGLIPLLNGADDSNIQVLFVDGDDDDNDPDGVNLVFDPESGRIHLAGGKSLASGVTVVYTADPGMEMVTGSETTGAEPTLKVLSNAIEIVSLTETDAIVLVENDSKDEDDKGTPEDLSVTVAEFGGKLCLQGAGTSENVMIETVEDTKESSFALASNSVKTIGINAGSDLELDVYKFDNETASTSLESVTIAGAGDVTMSAEDMTKLEGVDASGASGGVTVMGVGDSVESYMGSSGKDTVGMAEFAEDGISVDLGDGGDVFIAGAGTNEESRVEGGDGTDVLFLADASDASYMVDGEAHSVYTGFEVLDVALGSGDFDIDLLGVDYVQVSRGTTGEVTLENMSDGMGITVSGVGGRGATGRSTNTAAEVVHEIEDRQPGESRYSGDLEVTLVANGYRDTKSGGTRGDVTLDLTPDTDTGSLTVTSNANAHSSGTTTATNRVSASDYVNTINVNETADGASIEEIFVRGNAQLVIDDVVDTTFDQLELVDATGNSGGVTFDASEGTALTQTLELYGGTGDDVLTGGDGDDEIGGGGGGDMLAGGGGDDTFEYYSASDSQISFDRDGEDLGGYDTITGFNGDAGDIISLGRSLFRSLTGDIEAGVINSTDDAADETARTDDNPATNPTANSLYEYLGNGENIFRTFDPNTDGFGGTAGRNSIEVVAETFDGGTRTWILIDVDGDGNFDTDTDMVIALAGTVTVEVGDFSA